MLPSTSCPPVLSRHLTSSSTRCPVLHFNSQACPPFLYRLLSHQGLCPPVLWRPESSFHIKAPVLLSLSVCTMPLLCCLRRTPEIPRIVLCSLVCSVHGVAYCSVQCVVCSVHGVAYCSVQCVVCSVHGVGICSVQCVVCSIQDVANCSVQCDMCSV